jgi:hypothetical protein
MNDGFDPCTVISTHGQRKNEEISAKRTLCAPDNLQREEKYFDIAMQNCAVQTND